MCIFNLEILLITADYIYFSQKMSYFLNFIQKGISFNLMKY